MNTVETVYMSHMAKKNWHEDNRTYRSRKDNKIALKKVKRELMALRDSKEKDGVADIGLINCRHSHAELCRRLRSKGAVRRTLQD